MDTSPVDALIRKSVTASAGESLDLLARAVQIPTISGDEDLGEELFRSWFAARSWQVDRQVLGDTAVAATPRGQAEPRLDHRDNLIGWYGAPTGKPVVTLNAHYDVVPIIDLEDWTDEPFSGVRRGGAVFGRGAVDNKGGCIAALYALQALTDVAAQMPFDLAVELIAGEETTGLGTVASLELPFDRLASIVIEPTSGAVVTVNSGAIFFTVEVAGRAVHTSVPWRGEDAVRKIVAIYEALHELGETRGQTHRHPSMEHLPSSVPMVVGTLSGGGWRAALPAHASMSGRIGVLPGEPVDDVKNAVLETIAAVSAKDSWLMEHPPIVRWDNDGLVGWELQESHPLVEAMTHGQRSAGLAAHTEGLTTGCDAGTLRRSGIPVVVFGPGDLARAHSPNEYILDSEVLEATQILATGLIALGARVEAGDLS